jgi:hypothetical protein
MYGVRLAKNADRYLMGFDDQPQWLFDPHHEDGAVKQIYAWWASRWAAGRAAREDVLAAIKKETLVHPIRHGGRVPRHSPKARQSSFFDV